MIKSVESLAVKDAAECCDVEVAIVVVVEFRRGNSGISGSVNRSIGGLRSHGLDLNPSFKTFGRE